MFFETSDVSDEVMKVMGQDAVISGSTVITVITVITASSLHQRRAMTVME